MANKPGRNDPCPGGSGKKYKKCHGRLEQTSQTSLPPDVFPEDVVVSEILRTSPQFRAFYDTERKRIPHRVEWKLNPSLPESMGGRTYRQQRGIEKVVVVELRQIPPPPERIVSIAHGLMHPLVAAEGFPQVVPVIGVGPNWMFLAGALNSMVHDIIVDSRLQAYGFDMQRKFENEANSWARGESATSTTSPTLHEARMLSKFDYVGELLEYQRLTAAGAVFTTPPLAWYEAKFPDMAAEAQEILTLVNEIGFDTPEKMARLFTEIISRYRLGHGIRLIA
jgi:hypothetical protein